MRVTACLTGGGFLLIALLTLLWSFLPPVSTLMLSYTLTGREYTRIAVPLEEISPNLIVAVIHYEDGKFCNHGGVDWDSLTSVLTEDGSPHRGASTIPMQTVKNLYLWHGRSYIRKAVEIPITLFVSLVWSKRRIMETYLNIAEWGDGIIGAEAAARHYFNKSAKNLNRQEAALLASALPNPFIRDTSRPTKVHQKLAGVIMARMDNRVVADCVLKKR